MFRVAWKRNPSVAIIRSSWRPDHGKISLSRRMFGHESPLNPSIDSSTTPSLQPASGNSDNEQPPSHKHNHSSTSLERRHWAHEYQRLSSAERLQVLKHTILPRLAQQSSDGSNFDALQRLDPLITEIASSPSTPHNLMLMKNDLRKLNFTSKANDEQSADGLTAKDIQMLLYFVNHVTKIMFPAASFKLVQVTPNSSATLLSRVGRLDRALPPLDISSLIQNRIGGHKLCYALTHPMLPNFPASFVHFAMTTDLASSMRY